MRLLVPVMALLAVLLFLMGGVVRLDERLAESNRRLRESTAELQRGVFEAVMKGDVLQGRKAELLASVRWLEESLGVRLANGT